MKATNIILAGIAGTTAFTLFSYIISSVRDENFKQPDLLGKLVDRSTIDIDKKTSVFTGWLLHYCIGIGLAASYKIMVDVTGIKPSVKNGIITGALTGAPAILSWHSFLTLSPAPPRKKTWDYYLELICGHIVFGTVCFWLLNRKGHNVEDGKMKDLSQRHALQLTT